MPEEFDAIAFLTDDNTPAGEGEGTPAGEGEGAPAGEGSGAGEAGTPAGEGKPEDGEGEETPAEDKPEAKEPLTPEQLAKGYEELKGAWQKNLPVLELLDRATQATPDDQELADRSARQIILAVAQARGLSPEQLVGVLYKGETPPAKEGESAGQDGKFVAPKMPKPFDEMTHEEMESWMVERDTALMAFMEKQNKAQLEPLTKEVEQKQQATEFAKKVEAAYPKVSAAILQESGGFKPTPEQVAKAMRAYPSLAPLEATQLVYRKEIAAQAQKASGPKDGKTAPESQAGGMRKEMGAASFVTDPVAAAIGHLTGGSTG
jgi:hypothetical protein